MKKMLCAFVLLLSMPLVGAEKPHFISQLRDGMITADGKFDDWYGNLEPFGTAPIAAQVLNDKDFLYLRLTSSDLMTRGQLRRVGFTVWFDSAGGTRKKFGIRYPVVEAGEPGARGGGFGRGGGRGPEREGDRPDDTLPVNRVDILGPGKDDARSLTRDHLQGVDVAIHTEQGVLQYELKVPLARTAEHPFAIETEPGKTIGLGLETGKMPQRGGPGGEGRGGGFGGGGMPGRGGGGMGGRGRSGGSGGGRGGGEFQPPKPLKAWATVAIAPAR